MATPNILISHRWNYGHDYYNLVSKFDQYGFNYLNYSVPEHDPFDVSRVNQIEAALQEQIRQCNYFIIFANMAIGNSPWVKYEVEVATGYKKPILSVRPYGYNGNVPLFIQQADTEGGDVGFNTPAIIRKICAKLNHPLPIGI